MMVDMKQIFVTDNYQDGNEILVVHFGLVRTLVFSYILHEQEITPYDQRIREVKASIFTPPALSTGIWKEQPQS